jgi:hypothetical protein
MPVGQFVQRYKHCAMVSIKVKKTDSVNLRDLALAMLNELSLKLGIENPTVGMATWAVGTTRVFFRTLKVKYALEECRNNSVDFVALQIQRFARSGDFASSFAYKTTEASSQGQSFMKQKWRRWLIVFWNERRSIKS